MTKEKVLEDISSLIQDIDKCTEDLLDGRYSHNKEKFHASELQMEKLMIAAHQELTFLYDYIKEGCEE